MSTISVQIRFSACLVASAFIALGLAGAFYVGVAVAPPPLDVCAGRYLVREEDSEAFTGSSCLALDDTFFYQTGSLEDCPHECDALFWKSTAAALDGERRRLTTEASKMKSLPKYPTTRYKINPWGRGQVIDDTSDKYKNDKNDATYCDTKWKTSDGGFICDSKPRPLCTLVDNLDYIPQSVKACDCRLNWYCPANDDNNVYLTPNFDIFQSIYLCALTNVEWSNADVKIVNQDYNDFSRVRCISEESGWFDGA